MINDFKITVLGTGTSVGIPALGQLGWGKCNPSNPKNKRQRCAVLIQSKNTTILVDAGPDIKNQLISGALPPQASVHWGHGSLVGDYDQAAGPWRCACGDQSANHLPRLAPTTALRVPGRKP